MSDSLGEKAYLQLKDVTNNNQIKGFKILTRAEYDALTEAEKNNGKAYLIKE